MAASAYDLIVLGSGPGGYVAAIRAAQLGLKTAIVEREHLGGICLNWGCIPTKALLRTAELYHNLHRLEAYGLSVSEARFDMAKVVARSRKVAAQLSSGVQFLMKKNKIAVHWGTGRLAGNGQVAVTKDGQIETLEAPHIILATGARARTLKGLEPDGRLVWTYKEAMVPSEMPTSLLVIGSGAIGIEFASFYRMLGATVTVVEIENRILPAEDEEISAFAQKQFARQGLSILTQSRVTSLERGANEVRAQIAGPDGKVTALTVDRVILAVGIIGNVEDLGLEALGVPIEKGHVVTGPWGETGVPGLYAIGDVAGPPWLAHKAMHEGVVCVERLSGVAGVHPLDAERVPGCTYSSPQVASVGLSEARARALGRSVRIGRFPFIGNGKAIALGETEGLVKTVFDAESGELLGAHMVGPDVTELIQGYTIARSLETTEAELMATIFPHPTLSEMMHEAVLDAYGRALHI